MRRRTQWILYSAAGLLALGGIGWAALGRKAGPEALTLARVARQDLVDSVRASGEVQARTRVNVGVQVTGAIQAIHVKDGQSVKAGDLLVTLDPEQVRQALAQAEMGLGLARKDLENAEAAFRKQEGTFARQEALHRLGLVSTEDFQTARLGRDTAGTAAERARVAVQQAEAAVALARDGLNRTSVRASMDGQITGLNAEKGETAIAGQTNLAGAVLMVISDLSELTVDFKVGDFEVVRLRAGQTAEIAVEAFPGRVFPGRVLSLAYGGDRMAGQRPGGGPERQSYRVRVQFAGAREDLAGLRPGMGARVAVLAEERRGALAVPPAAVQERDGGGSPLGLLGGSRSVAFVVRSGRLEERTLRLGLATRKAVEVLGGLAEGEEVVTGPAQALPTLAAGKAVPRTVKAP